MRDYKTRRAEPSRAELAWRKKVDLRESNSVCNSIVLGMLTIVDHPIRWGLPLKREPSAVAYFFVEHAITCGYRWDCCTRRRIPTGTDPC